MTWTAVLSPCTEQTYRLNTHFTVAAQVHI